MKRKDNTIAEACPVCSTLTTSFNKPDDDSYFEFCCNECGYEWEERDTHPDFNQKGDGYYDY